eukprot:CAMPEP_0197858414 /NCGR_PEP_ID=MMETSP1438-20131217/32206_1 /TAXON_ID=1461541 /ORGANISM="Pterosperma sp., Strain CCMP1384" /LENGTH=88 /DNA_ID=CAMNT_0043474567 /DNA_START=93 /DNA_END=356 /DNA_ORIENTATION=+
MSGNGHTAPVQNVDALEFEKGRLENAVFHLVRSNNELQVAFEEDPDEEYSKAIEENKDVIANMQRKIAELQAEIDSLRPAGPHYATTV